MPLNKRADLISTQTVYTKNGDEKRRRRNRKEKGIAKERKKVRKRK